MLPCPEAFKRKKRNSGIERHRKHRVICNFDAFSWSLIEDCRIAESSPTPRNSFVMFRPMVIMIVVPNRSISPAAGHSIGKQPCSHKVEVVVTCFDQINAIMRTSSPKIFFSAGRMMQFWSCATLGLHYASPRRERSCRALEVPELPNMMSSDSCGIAGNSHH